MLRINERGHVGMSSPDETLNIEYNGTVMQILQLNGLKQCAKLICKYFSLHTLHDIGNLSALQLNSIELEASLKSQLRELSENCRDANAYRAYRLDTLNREAYSRRVLDKDDICARNRDKQQAQLRDKHNTEMQSQKLRERRDAVHKSTFLPHKH